MNGKPIRPATESEMRRAFVHLDAALGYLELSLPELAVDELDQIDTLFVAAPIRQQAALLRRRAAGMIEAKKERRSKDFGHWLRQRLADDPELAKRVERERREMRAGE